LAFGEGTRVGDEPRHLFGLPFARGDDLVIHRYTLLGLTTRPPPGVSSTSSSAPSSQARTSSSGKRTRLDFGTFRSGIAFRRLSSCTVRVEARSSRAHSPVVK